MTDIERPCRPQLDADYKPIKDDDGNRLRTLNNRHLRDCNTSGCPGCQPCTERHCQVCRHQHVTVDGRGHDQTCATCLGHTRTHLSDIWILSTALLGEAISRGIRSAAVNLAGPVADVETWSNRRASVLAGRIDPSWLTEQGKELSDDDVPHPLWVLATWEREVRVHIGQVLSPGSSRPTLTEARDFLEHQLTWLAHDATFDFRGLATALRECRDHLERAVQLEEHHDTGAPCPACGRGRLRKDYGTTDNDDRWTCPKCQQWWTEGDYRAKVTGSFIALAPALTIADLADRIRVRPTLLRTWAAPVRTWVDGALVNGDPRLPSVGRDHAGRKLYPVDIAEKLRDETCTATA